MARTLRKGYAPVELQYDHGADEIGAIEYEADVRDNYALVRFKLRAAGGNQKSDEENLHTKELRSVCINDEQVLNGLQAFLSARRQEFSGWKIAIVSKGRSIERVVVPSRLQWGGIQFTVS